MTRFRAFTIIIIIIIILIFIIVIIIIIIIIVTIIVVTIIIIIIIIIIFFFNLNVKNEREKVSELYSDGHFKMSRRLQWNSSELDLVSPVMCPSCFKACINHEDTFVIVTWTFVLLLRNA